MARLFKSRRFTSNFTAISCVNLSTFKHRFEPTRFPENSQHYVTINFDFRVYKMHIKTPPGVEGQSWFLIHHGFQKLMIHNWYCAPMNVKNKR